MDPFETYNDATHCVTHSPDFVTDSGVPLPLRDCVNACLSLKVLRDFSGKQSCMESAFCVKSAGIGLTSPQPLTGLVV